MAESKSNRLDQVTGNTADSQNEEMDNNSAVNPDPDGRTATRDAQAVKALGQNGVFNSGEPLKKSPTSLPLPS